MRFLSITNLETAIWIARLGSFTAAAERLHTTQPAVSTRIRELESALGIKLFVRATRGVVPTIEGRSFLEKADPLLQHLQELSASVESGGAVGGIVRVGSGNISMEWFPALVLELRNIFPKLRWDVELGMGNRMLQRLEARRLDLAIVSGPVDESKFECRTLGYDRMVWVASPQLVAGCTESDIDRFLERVPLWCVQRESFYWEDAHSVLGDQGRSAELNAIDNMAAATQIALHGGGAALLSETLIQRELARGTLVPLPGIRPGTPVEFSIAWSRGERHPVLMQIVDAALRVSTFAKSAGVEDGPTPSS